MIYYLGNKMENKHISLFRIINTNLENKIDSFDSELDKISELDEYDIIFQLDEIIENNNILYISGFVGYSFDDTSVKFIYDMNENKIYIDNQYRTIISIKEYDLFVNTYKISYDKIWKYEKINNQYCLLERTIDVKYKENNATSIPYYRFPRTKDGISIPRLVYNIFTIFRDENSIKPLIIFPNNLNIYKQYVE